MKHSLKKQMSVIFIGLIAFIIVMIFIVNSSFLERYYQKNKEAELMNFYTEVENALIDSNISEDGVQETLGYTAEKMNVSAMVAEGNVIIFQTAREDNNMLMIRLAGYLFEKNQKGGELLAQGDNYEIRKVKDWVSKSDYMEMWGYLDENHSFIIRTPLESIKESATLANQFLIYLGVFAILISIILVQFFAKRITDPILKLAELSKRMANLDFDAKYVSTGEDEIGQLGENFNIMSETLKNTITELKNANVKLKQDIAQKEKLEDMRSEFLGNVSHELKTPIALIQGYAEGLKEGINEDPESREFYCDVIMDEANKMNQMVKNLLTLNQLEFGQDDTLFERFDLTALICGVVQSCEILVQQAEAKISFVETDPVYVWADEFKTEQVIRNYVTNAIHHVDNEKRIEIKVTKNNDIVRVSVFNSGIPIPEEDLDKLWDKFYKVDKAHTREYGGNGIGLSIVRAIMESFHQQYGVQNYDNGVEFWFELDAK